jgi:hypothetical protein
MFCENKILTDQHIFRTLKSENWSLCVYDTWLKVVRAIKMHVGVLVSTPVSLTRHWMEAIGQIDAFAALNMGKESSVPIG